MCLKEINVAGKQVQVYQLAARLSTMLGYMIKY